MQTTKLAIFEQKEIRKVIHENEWHFSVVDIIEVLTWSPTPRQYWGKIKKENLQILNCPQFGYSWKWKHQTEKWD